MQAALRICKMTLPFAENLLLNAYSTLVNFFVPGQGGLALRGVYLKKKHNLRLRNYVLSVMVYYACYALVSAFLLLVTSRPWWQTIVGVIIVGLGSLLGLRWYARRSTDKLDKLEISSLTISYMLGATIIQAIIQITIYMVELHTVNPHIKLSQAITYTGAANFALFVALTPGAIGIRESFLLFSERLHHVSTANVVAASLIDRAVFLVFLGLLFIFTLSIHAKNRLQIGQIGKTEGADKPES